MAIRGDVSDLAELWWCTLQLFQTLKIEEVCLKIHRNIEKTEEHVAEFIGEIYRHKSLHSSLGHLPPVEFGVQHHPKARR